MTTAKRWSFLAAFLCLTTTAHGQARDVPPLTIVDANGQRVHAAAIPKGTTTSFMAQTGSGAIPFPIEWRAEPKDVVRIEPMADGGIAVTPLRDAFDDPQRREPTVMLHACVPTFCTLPLIIAAVPDMAGRWPTALEGRVLFFSGREQRMMVFAQRGREVTFDPEPGSPAKEASRRMATLVISGTNLTLDPARRGSILLKFSGALTSRTSANGTFESVHGPSGTWSAKKAQ